MKNMVCQYKGEMDKVEYNYLGVKKVKSIGSPERDENIKYLKRENTCHTMWSSET